jgi:hypothetical protein
MNVPAADPRASLRRAAYGLLIALSVGTMTGRILTVTAPDGRLPFLSANDRSRWCTIRALVDYGTFAIDRVIEEQGWDTIDKVRHTGRDGLPHYYSSKPPLLLTVLAGEYWVVKAITGTNLAERPFYIVRLMLILTNVVPLVVYFVVLARLVERHGRTDWGRIFVMAAGTGGTLLTTFAVTINNHLLAAVCVLVAVHAALLVWYEDQRRWEHFAVAGFFAALAVTCELPALAFCALLGAGLIAKSVRHGMLGFVPAAAVVFVAFFGTNYASHDTWLPPYVQRHVPGGWYDWPESPWLDPEKSGPDAGEPSRAVYAFQVLAGHHGVFSLTPVWLLSMLGLGIWLFGPGPRPRSLAAMVGLLTVVCLVFYVVLRPEEDRNYGGMTSGFRWLFWLAPLWLLTMIPASDLMSSRRLWRTVAIVLLIISVISATYPAANPWSHPWIFQYWRYLGWI